MKIPEWIKALWLFVLIMFVITLSCLVLWGKTTENITPYVTFQVCEKLWWKVWREAQRFICHMPFCSEEKYIIKIKK